MSYAILAIGEVLWDLLPAGKQLGGAPANFAFHARSLGADAKLVTRIGNDDLGHEILQRFKALGLPTENVQVDDALPTGTVTVALDADGQPRYTIHENVAWDRIEANRQALNAAADADAICFGSLSQRSVATREAVHRLLDAARPGALRVFDVNLRPPFIDRELIEESLERADVLKLNDQELPILASLFGVSGTDHEAILGLVKRFDLRAVALTRGAEGSLLLQGAQWSEHAGRRIEVRDTIGAGDAFTAALIVGLLAGRPLDEINRHANDVAAFVCSQAGGTPSLPESLKVFSVISPEERS
jgi:fructokinase